MTRPLTASLEDLRRALSSPGGYVLDVRPPEAFAAGRIPGARNLPLAEVPRALAEDSPKLPAPGAEIVAYCAGPN